MAFGWCMTEGEPCLWVVPKGDHGQHSNGFPGDVCTLCYVTWQGETKVADEIKVAVGLETMIILDYLGPVSSQG
jgi:hypothetical protein